MRFEVEGLQERRVGFEVEGLRERGMWLREKGEGSGFEREGCGVEEEGDLRTFKEVFECSRVI